MHKTSFILFAVVALFFAGCTGDTDAGGGADRIEATVTRESVTFYASFDKNLEADFGGGPKSLRTRYGALNNPAAFRFEDGYPQQVFRVAPQAGVHGGALEALDILPDTGRIFFPAEGNLPYDPNGWSGTVSFWIKTNPDTMLKTRYCDPIQITQKGAGNGGLWIDFPDSSPRDLRLGAFQSEGEGRERIPESDPNPPLVVVSPIGFKETDWHHILFVWTDFDSEQDNAKATLYIDGKPQGSIGDRNITMDWDITRTGIYVAVGYIGLLDELAIFDRPLTEDEIALLAAEPNAVAALFVD
jgi:hypothetical protein